MLFIYDVFIHVLDKSQNKADIYQEELTWLDVMKSRGDKCQNTTCKSKILMTENC